MNSHYDKLVFNFINEYKLPLLLYIVVVLCTWPAETIVLSKLYGMLVGSLKTKFSMGNMFHFQKNIEQQNMFGILTLVFIVYIIIIGFYRVKFAIEEKLIPEYIKYIRTLFIDGIIQNSSENFKDIRTGDYIQKIVEISNVLSQGLTQLANTFLPFFLGIIAVSFYYLYENIYLGGLSLFLCAIRLYLNISDGIWYSNVAAERDTYFFDMIEDVSDAFNNAMNIHLNNQASEEKERTEEQQKEYNKLYEKEIRTRSQLTIKRNIFTIISFVVLVVAAYYLYSKKKISFIVLLTVVMIEIKIIGRFIHFDETSLHFFSKLGTMTSSRSFLNEVLNDSKTTKSKCSPNDNSIVMKNVTFNYKTSGNSKTVFEKLNMTVNTGQKVALVGSSGSGKSTLMKLLVKLQKPTKGSVIIGGCDIQSMNTERLRDKITYVNQRTN